MKQPSLTIGIIIPQFPSYTETFFLSQVIGLCERGYIVNVFCNSVNTDPVMEKIFRLKQYGNLHIIPLGAKKLSIAAFKSLLFHPLNFIKWIRIPGATFKKEMYEQFCKIYFKKHACDIYHFGYSGTAISYLALFDSLPGKIMVSCLGTAENVKPLSEPERAEKLNTLFQKTDKVHCVSARMERTIQAYGATPEKIFINRPAIDTTVFARKEYYQATKKIQLLSIGRLVFQKGFLTGILAIAELKKKYNDFSWIIVGEGPEQEELIFYIHLFQLENNVVLAGKKTRDEVLKLYHQTDIFFLPSVSEGIANVILEAMAMEIPVVASNSGGIEEAITNKVNGMLCKNYDFESMANEIYLLCQNFEQRKLLGLQGRKTVEESFAIKRYIDVFEKEYHTLVNTKSYL